MSATTTTETTNAEGLTLGRAGEAPGPGVSAVGTRAADAREAEVRARMRLAGTPGLSPRLQHRLVTRFGSARAVLAASVGRLTGVPGMGAARAALVVDAPTDADADAELERLSSASATVLIPGDPHWPVALDELHDPPLLLFARGELLETDALAVGIVGSRRPSAYGVSTARRLAHGLAELGITVVSGLARGVDTAAHKGAVSAGGRTVAVLGGGFARFYPPENVRLARTIAEGHGAVLSEFRLDTPPRPYNFPRRNRLLAALSRAVVVVEAGERSGSLITADHALDLGRDVLAVPGRIDAPTATGTHRLLREGAALCASVEDVLVAMGLELEEPGEGGESGAVDRLPVRRRNRAEEALLAALAGEELHTDELLTRTGLQPDQALGALSALELEGAVELGPDGRYARA